MVDKLQVESIKVFIKNLANVSVEMRNGQKNIFKATNFFLTYFNPTLNTKIKMKKKLIAKCLNPVLKKSAKNSLNIFKNALKCKM